MVYTNTTISVIILNENGLNILSKRLRLSGWIEKQKHKTQLHVVYKRIT